MKQLYNTREMIEYLHISYPTLYKWVREEGLPGFKLGGSLRFKITEVDEWMTARKMG
jgi:excisionase family DNA binding protein